MHFSLLVTGRNRRRPVIERSFLERPYVATPELTWALRRGVSDADGCIRIYERSNVVTGKEYGPYRRARRSLTIGLPFVEGLVKFLAEENIATAAACIQKKAGTSLFEMSSQSAIRQVSERRDRDGSLRLRRKKRMFDRVKSPAA